MIRIIVAALLAGALCQAGPARAQTQAEPFLAPAERLDIRAWLPPTPAPGSPQDRLDIQAFLDSRPLVATVRGRTASDDDVYAPKDLAPRFAAALGFTPTPEATPRLLDLLKRVERDAELLTDPVKLDPPAGRVRPFVADKGQPTCPLKPDDIKFRLPQTGSYPSVHSALGMLFALTLEQLEPGRADALIARGMAFGESRVVCGFHYPSDVTAGRLAGTLLFARLVTQPQFRAELAAAKAEYDQAKSRRP